MTTSPTTVGQPEAAWRTDLAELRANTYRTIAALYASLPPPARVHTQRTEFSGPNSGKVGLSLMLAFDNPPDVDAWAKHLGIPSAESRPLPDLDTCVYETEWRDWERPVWIGWHLVQLQAFVPAPDDLRLPKEES